MNSKQKRQTLPTPRGAMQVLQDPFTWIDAANISLLTGAGAIYVIPIGLSGREVGIVMGTVFAASVLSKVILGTQFGLDIVEKLDDRGGIGFLQ